MVNVDSKKFQPKIMFWVITFTSLSFGLGFAFFPKFVFELLGFSTNNDGLMMVRYLGIMFVGLAIMYFSIRNIKLSKTRETFQIYFVFSHIFGGVLLILYAALDNTSVLTNVFYWLTVSLHLIVPSFFIYFIIRDWKEVRASGKAEL